MASSNLLLSRFHLPFLCALAALFVSASVEATRNRKLCNAFNPNCALSAKDAQRAFLTPYDKILPKLRRIERRIPWAMTVAPLIRNAPMHGILDIDKYLEPAHPNVNISVCPAVQHPTVRQAVICTVLNDKLNPPRGNTNASKIGYSTQGRPLLAVRLANPRFRSAKVMVVTQQHGNEPASTEAVINFLDLVSRHRRLRTRLLRSFRLLFVVRANPDAGEPLAENNPPPAPFLASQGFFRHNVDPTAGGGFVADTEPGFFGVVGRGYDPNRYHFVKLNAPIRPVETQAIVAAVHAFRPDIVLDMHGDVQKAACAIDSTSVTPRAVIGSLPSAKCLPPADGVPTVLTDLDNTVIGSFFADDRVRTRDNRSTPLRSSFTAKEQLLRTVLSQVVAVLQPKLRGTLTRFSQVLFERTADDTGSSNFEDAALTPAGLHMVLPDIGVIASGWEVLSYGKALRQAVAAVRIVDGKPVPRVSMDVPGIEPCWLSTNICLNELFLRTWLLAMSKSGWLPHARKSFCDLPLATGLVASAPASLGWGAMSLENATLVPIGLQFGAPGFFSGTCPVDYSS